jgi:flagellar biosynthesis protein FliR
MLAELAADQVFAVMLVFARTGAALMLLPGFGEPYVYARGRLALALLVALALAVPLMPVLPPVPGEPALLVALVAHEVVVGLFIGAAARALFAALHIAGQMIAMQSSLAAATFFDPNEGTQGSLPGNLLATLGIVLLFVTDGHHIMLQALAASYERLPLGEPAPLGELGEMLARFVAAAFATGLRIAAPIVVVGLLLYLAMGILNRLMPAFQVFFVILPLQILLAFAVLLIAVPGGMLAFLVLFEDGLATLALGG